MEQTLFTPQEAAKLLNVSIRSLIHWRLCKKGPKYHKMGGQVRYSKHDLDAFLSQTLVETKSPKIVSEVDV
ncbi:MAG: helix-turn-helix domain-containing protein [Nitrospirae bacterium]|nr:helix-turn-helix domain-containing protein [Nitrospirota bacterium]